MNRNINELIAQMTLEEKASLCSGLDFWHTKPLERLGIPSLMLSDGPHGLRKQDLKSDHLGIHQSVPATCFPTASATASSWDVDLMYNIGEAIAEECIKQEVDVVLGPGANIKRSPLCGRNFEYISEDPYLTGEMAAALIKGVQSKNVGTSLKHFAANNQERLRMTIDALVDERALREIYLAGFEKAVKQAKPWTVMCAYNRLNGEYCSENKTLLNDILRDEWGFEGIVMTDWGACNDRAKGLEAGQDLEMPTSYGFNDAKIVEAVKEGKLDEKTLDNVLKRLLKLIFECSDAQHEPKKDIAAHHALAQKAAEKSAVLLKNGGVLPLDKKQKVALIGAFAKFPRYQGSGSSRINPWKLDSAYEHFENKGIDFVFCEGYDLKADTADESLIAQAAKAAESADAAVIYAGLPEIYESEGFDRAHIDLPEAQNRLIEKVTEVNPNTVVVLQNGAPAAMPWIDAANAVLECYLGGQAGGAASVEILIGDVNPSGKLAETFPLSLEDTPCYKWFPGDRKSVMYAESIYVGYRYYDTAGKDVLFPFGHGLSYTQFEYSNLHFSKGCVRDGENITVSFTVKNTGEKAGGETAQLYVTDDETRIFRPSHELKGFAKVYLEAGEEKRAEMILDKRAFAYYDTKIKDWYVEPGCFTISVGASSRDIRLTGKIEYKAAKEEKAQGYKKELDAYYNIKSGKMNISREDFEHLLGRALPRNDENTDISINSTISELKETVLGDEAYLAIKKSLVSGLFAGDDSETVLMMAERILEELPLRVVARSGMGGITLKKAEELIEDANKKANT